MKRPRTRSISAAERSETHPNWLKMPDEIMEMILQRLGALQILKNAQKVCTTWRRICKDPTTWKVIDIRHCRKKADTEKLIKEALHRSCGELIDIRLHHFCTDDILDYISRCSSKLKHLRLSHCFVYVTGCGLNCALKRLPHLETLVLSATLDHIYPEDIKVIGHNCPQLKSFKMKQLFIGRDFVRAIANSMSALRHLKLDGIAFYRDDDSLRAILNGCPHLESLDLRGHSFLRLNGNLEKECRERIKDFKIQEFKWNQKGVSAVARALA